MTSHDEDRCFCGEDFDGLCPCPCEQCRFRSVDPVEFMQSESGARALLAWMELLNDQQWPEFKKWLLLHGPSAAPYFPAFISYWLEVQYAEWDKMTIEQKLRHEEMLLTLDEFEKDCAEVDAVFVSRRRKAEEHYMKRLQRQPINRLCSTFAGLAGTSESSRCCLRRGRD